MDNKSFLEKIESELIKAIPLLETDLESLSDNDRERAMQILNLLKQRKKDKELERVIAKLRELSQENDDQVGFDGKRAGIE